MPEQPTPTPPPEVIEAIRSDPAQGRLDLAVSGELLEGLRCRAAVREHGLTLDEPAGLGGTDAGPNPVELVLTALGACQAITYRIWAELLGVRLDDVRFETEGDIDLAGFLGPRDGVRPGLGAVRHRVVLVGPEPEGATGSWPRPSTATARCSTSSRTPCPSSTSSRCARRRLPGRRGKARPPPGRYRPRRSGRRAGWTR